jgi:hypothetical protein
LQALSLRERERISGNNHSPRHGAALSSSQRGWKQIINRAADTQPRQTGPAGLLSPRPNQDFRISAGGFQVPFSPDSFGQ